VNNSATDDDTIAIMTLIAFLGVGNRFIIATTSGMKIRIIDLTVKRNQKGHDESGDAGRLNKSCNSLCRKSKNGISNNQRETFIDFFAFHTEKDTCFMVQSM
jgi:hypothetical protein